MNVGAVAEKYLSCVKSKSLESLLNIAHRLSSLKLEVISGDDTHEIWFHKYKHNHSVVTTNH